MKCRLCFTVHKPTFSGYWRTAWVLWKNKTCNYNCRLELGRTQVCGRKKVSKSNSIIKNACFFWTNIVFIPYELGQLHSESTKKCQCRGLTLFLLLMCFSKQAWVQTVSFITLELFPSLDKSLILHIPCSYSSCPDHLMSYFQIQSTTQSFNLHLFQKSHMQGSIFNKIEGSQVYFPFD